LGALNRLFLLRVKLKALFETSLNLNFELLFSCGSRVAAPASAWRVPSVCEPVLPELGLVVAAPE